MTEPGRLRVSSPRGTIRIVLVEDNRLVRDQLAEVLERQPNVKVVARAASAAAGVAKVRELKPDVALVNAGLGPGEGQLCLESARQVAPEAKVILMDVFPDREDIVRLIKAGANGFILKDATIDDLVGTIRTVADGRNVLPGTLTPALWSYLATDPIAEESAGNGQRPAVRLTRREREITELIADGLANGQVARRLGVTVHTVKSHIHNVLNKLGLHSRLQISAHVHRLRAGP